MGNSSYTEIYIFLSLLSVPPSFRLMNLWRSLFGLWWADKFPDVWTSIAPCRLVPSAIVKTNQQTSLLLASVLVRAIKNKSSLNLVLARRVLTRLIWLSILKKAPYSPSLSQPRSVHCTRIIFLYLLGRFCLSFPRGIIYRLFSRGWGGFFRGSSQTHKTGKPPSQHFKNKISKLRGWRWGGGGGILVWGQ